MIGSSRYPLLAYQVTYSAPVSFDVRVTRSVGGNIDVVATIPADTYWGQDSTTVAGSDTPHGALVAAIDAALATAGFAGATVTGTWDLTGAWPAVSITVGGIANALTWRITSPTLNDALRLGYQSTVVVSTAMVITTGGNCDGIWSPCVPWSDVDLQTTRIASQTVSPFDPSAATIVKLGDRDVMVPQWLYVPMRYIERDWCNVQACATQAGTAITDDYGSLSRVVAALVDDQSDLRLVTYDSLVGVVDTDVRAAWDSDLSTATWSKQDGSGGRRYRVTIPLIKL